MLVSVSEMKSKLAVAQNFKKSLDAKKQLKDKLNAKKMLKDQLNNKLNPIKQQINKMKLKVGTRLLLWTIEGLTIALAITAVTMLISTTFSAVEEFAGKLTSPITSLIRGGTVENVENSDEKAFLQCLNKMDITEVPNMDSIVSLIPQGESSSMAEAFILYRMHEGSTDSYTLFKQNMEEVAGETSVLSTLNKVYPGKYSNEQNTAIAQTFALITENKVVDNNDTVNNVMSLCADDGKSLKDATFVGDAK